MAHPSARRTASSRRSQTEAEVRHRRASRHAVAFIRLPPFGCRPPGHGQARLASRVQTHKTPANTCSRRLSELACHGVTAQNPGEAPVAAPTRPAEAGRWRKSGEAEPPLHHPSKSDQIRAALRSSPPTNTPLLQNSITPFRPSVKPGQGSSSVVKASQGNSFW